MSTHNLKEPQTWREGRRLRAWDLSQQGWAVGQIAEALGVSHGAVSQWLKKARTAGRESLRAQPRPGRPQRLSAAQQERARELLCEGAAAAGFRGDRWTCDRVAALLRKEFGIAYHPAHVSRLLRQWGFSLQQPRRRKRERDETKIQAWRAQEVPALEKRGPRET